MQIKVNTKDERFMRLHSGSATGFYVSHADELFLVHLNGVSRITLAGGTSTLKVDELETPVRRLTSGDVVTIEF